MTSLKNEANTSIFLKAISNPRFRIRKSKIVILTSIMARDPVSKQETYALSTGQKKSFAPLKSQHILLSRIGTHLLVSLSSSAGKLFGPQSIYTIRSLFKNILIYHHARVI